MLSLCCATQGDEQMVVLLTSLLSGSLLSPTAQPRGVVLHPQVVMSAGCWSIGASSSCCPQSAVPPIVLPSVHAERGLHCNLGERQTQHGVCLRNRCVLLSC